MMHLLLRRILPATLPVLLAFGFSGCADTAIQSTWTAPAVGSIHFNKVFVLGFTQDDMSRRQAEIAIKGQITRMPAVASYEPLPDVSDIKDKAKVLKAIKESGADGVIVMRLLYADTKVTFGANTALPMEYQVFSDYYSTVYDVGAYYSSDTREVNADRVFSLEVRIFDAKSEKLLWSGITKSSKNLIKAHDVSGLITEVSNVIKETLKSQEFIH